jgi:hypothetical protein
VNERAFLWEVTKEYKGWKKGKKKPVIFLTKREKPIEIPVGIC